MADSKHYKIWMLSLVPSGRYGRWWIALSILLVGGAAYGVSGYIVANDRASFGPIPWSIAAFFVLSVAYIVPMFHYITMRTHTSLDTLGPYISSAERLSELHDSINKRPLGWFVRSTIIALTLWLIQSYFLSGSWAMMWRQVTTGLVPLAFTLGPLFVWLTMYVSMSALIQNALTFRKLVPELNTDLFEPNSYMPIGSMAVTSTLVSLGGMALMSVMWLDGPVNWWTTLPALIIFTPLVFLLLLLPVLPMHRRLLAQRQAALVETQAALRAARASTADAETALASQAAALSMRREVAELSVWPFDVGTVARFLSYAIIVPLTWAGAALIEMVVNALLE
ncbi:MAG: hypothetical protein AAGH65_09055 [Pseudomonadota bacterium]